MVAAPTINLSFGCGKGISDDHNSNGIFFSVGGKAQFYGCCETFCVTQPTLSRQIMNLEAELETQLFVRKSNTVTVTAAGMALYDGLNLFIGN